MRPGRPRSTEVDEAVLVSALKLLHDLGPEGVTMEAVAQEAGSAKSSIYRRYNNREEVLTAALDRLPGFEMPDDSLPTYDRLRECLLELYRTIDVIGLRAFSALLRGPEEAMEANRLRRTVFQPRVGGMITVMAQGIARREIRPESDLKVATNLLIGSLFAAQSGGLDDPDSWPEKYLELVWCALEVPQTD